MPIFGFLDSKRSIYLFDPIYPWTAESLIRDLLEMNSQSQEPINIFINSPGGYVTDALGIVDVMKAIKSPINTIILGRAASAASLIATCGGKRYISANSEVMIHEAAMQGFGYIDTRDEKFAKALKRLDETKIKLSESFKNIKLSEQFEVEQSEAELKKLHLLRTCSLKDRGVEITTATLESLKKNFEGNVRGQDISIDYTHDNDSGEKPAGAWIKSLEIEGDNLFAMVELTPVAEEMIKNKEYKYLSVEIDPLYCDNEGKMHSNVLLGGTFTNRPAVKGLDPIKLSENNNQNDIEMKLNLEEISSIEALKAENIEIKDFYKSFAEMKSQNAALVASNAELKEEKTKFETKAAEVTAILAKIEADKITAEKIAAVESLIQKGTIANSQKEKVLNKFSSKSEIEDFYSGVPASIKVRATGSDTEDSSSVVNDARLAELSKQTGQSVEDLKKYGLSKNNN